LDRLALSSAMSPTLGSARETDERRMQRLREKSEEGKSQRFREMVTQVKMRLDY